MFLLYNQLMTAEEKFKLITRNLEEVLTEEELKTLIESGTPLKHYIGFEISGKVHLGTGLATMLKIKDLQEAGVETTILTNAVLPDSCKTPYKKRYNANKILQHLAIIKPKQIPYILALTTAGIATKKGNYKEWGILGLGMCPGPCCVVSTANMGKNKNRLKDRLVKVCLHEMGHNFGLPHCNKNDKRCLMRDANGTVRTVDEEEKYLCLHCIEFLNKKGFRLKQNS